MSQLFTLPRPRPLTTAGRVMPASKLYFYRVGTPTLADIYSDADCTVEHANPVVADANGEFDAIYLDNPRDATLKTSADVTVWGPETVGPSDGDVYNVRNYGAIADGATDDSAAIQAAVDAAGPTGVVYLPPGSYAIETKITINEANVQIRGAGIGGTYIINKTTNSDAFHFLSASTASTSTYMSGCSIQDMYIYRSTAATSGAGVRLTQCSNFRMDNVIIDSCPEGLVLQGGQLNTFTRFSLFGGSAMTDVSGTSGTALLNIDEAPVDGGLYQLAYTASFSDFKIAGSYKVESCINISSADGLQFNNGYVNGAVTSDLTVKHVRDSSTTLIGSVAFTNVYFDCVNNTDRCVQVLSDGFTASKVYQLKFQNCEFGNADETAVYVREDCYLDITGSWFGNCASWAVDYETTALEGMVVISGNQFSSIGGDAGATGTLRLSGPQAVTVAGNTFRSQTGTGEVVQLLGTITSAAITGNAFGDSDGLDLKYSTATITNLAIAGNSTRAGTATASATGLRAGNISITDVQTLDHYLEGTWTPGVTFGGGATGVTYTTQTAAYTRIGNRILFNVYIVLSSKGSSSGAVLVTGLPVASGYGAHQPCSLRVTGVTSGVGDTTLMAGVTNSATTIGLFDIATGAIAALTDADLTNTSAIEISGQYIV